MDDVVSRLLEGYCHILARRHSLDVARFRAVFHRLGDVPWLAGKLPGHTALDEVFKCLPPEDALRLFEDEDLAELGRRVALIDGLLVREFTPFYTLEELANLGRECVAHLERNRESLLLTGHPSASFARSPFLDWHLTRLYFTRLPLTVQGRRSPSHQTVAEMTDLAERDEAGNLIYSYTWAREPAEVLRVKETRYVHLRQLGYRRGSTGPVTAQGEPVNECSYEEAALAPGLWPEDAARLEMMRARLLDLRIRVVHRLSEAVLTRSACDLEEQCFTLLEDALTHEEAKFLLDVDLLYTVEGLRVDPVLAWAPARSRSVIFNNSGLFDLFHMIGHFAKEMTVGTMHRTALHLRSAVGEPPVSSYFQVVGRRTRTAVDAALDDFLRLERTEKGFMKEYYARVDRALETRLVEDVTVSRRVRRGWSTQFRSMLNSFADFVETLGNATGQFPTLSPSSPAVSPIVPHPQPTSPADAVLEVRVASHQAHFRGTPLSMPPRAFRVLVLLARQLAEGGEGWVTREAIYDTLWPGSRDDEMVYLSQIDDTVKELRRSLDRAEPSLGRRLVKTKSRVGYRLDLSPADVALR